LFGSLVLAPEFWGVHASHQLSGDLSAEPHLYHIMAVGKVAPEEVLELSLDDFAALFAFAPTCHFYCLGDFRMTQ
jgi:hypothetical protein